MSCSPHKHGRLFKRLHCTLMKRTRSRSESEKSDCSRLKFVNDRLAPAASVSSEKLAGPWKTGSVPKPTNAVRPSKRTLLKLAKSLKPPLSSVKEQSR